MKTLTTLITKVAITGGTFISLGLLSAPAQAINITYAFDDSFNSQSSVSQTLSGVTATFSNINSNPGTFGSSFYGIVLDSPGKLGNRFDISFNQSVKLLSYTVTLPPFFGGSATFDLSNPNGTGSTGNDFANVGNFNLSNQFILDAGQTSTLTATLSKPANSPYDNTAYLKSITVDATPVPWETDALPVVGSTILFGLGVWAKSKSTKPIQK